MGLFSKKPAAPRREYRTAIIDIGSNSIRLVVYAGPRRNPAIIYNEKVMAGLGAELSDTGRISDEAIRRGMRALTRFKSLIAEMRTDDVICVATAAVREADNGTEFADKVKGIGFDLAILSGEEEAEAAALGVLSAIPEAAGVVGDLGGGSLELAHIGGGAVQGRSSMPVGVLRVPALKSKGRLEDHIRDLLEKLSWLRRDAGEPFYLVGGSWRALARLDMHLTSYPLKVLHHYTISRKRMGELIAAAGKMDVDELRSVSEVPSSRASTLKDAAAILKIVDAYIKPSHYVVSAYGLREGLIYERMSEETRKRDPLLEPAGRFGRLQSRFSRNGAALYQWLAPLFPEETHVQKRLLLASCHLADVGWQANPDFRSDRGIEMALHGNWVGIDARGRMLVAQALSTSFGGGTSLFMADSGLASDAEMTRAVHWGLAIRLAKRLTGGTDGLLGQCSLRQRDGALQLVMQPDDAHLYGEIVERRHQKLAREMELEPELVVTELVEA